MRSVVAPNRSRLAAVALVVVLAAALAVGCASSGAGGAGSGSTAESPPPGAPRAYDFQVDATRAGLPTTIAGTPASLTWFPPHGTNGIVTLSDPSKVRALQSAVAANSRFSIRRSGSAASPVLSGSAARDLLRRRGGFSIATIVPVAPLELSGQAVPATVALAAPTSYQVFMEGSAGVTSFGLRRGAGSGRWLLDARGELFDWAAAQSAVKSDAGYRAKSATVTHATYGGGSQGALYMSWVVFGDASGNKRVSLLRDPPLSNDQWSVGGRPLVVGALFPESAVFSALVATPPQ